MVESAVNSFTAKMNELLQLEREAEMEETATVLAQYSFRELEKRNLAITKLFVEDVATGVYGRVLLRLKRGTKNGAKQGSGAAEGKNARDSDDQSKLRTFGPGDIVGLY